MCDATRAVTEFMVGWSGLGSGRPSLVCGVVWCGVVWCGVVCWDVMCWAECMVRGCPSICLRSDPSGVKGPSVMCGVMYVLGVTQQE